MKRLLLTRAAALALLAAGATAQQAVRPLPLDIVARDAAREQVVLAPRPSDLAELALYDELVLTGVPVPGGEDVSVSLTRLSVERRGFEFHVDGAPREGLLEGLALSVWRGTVVGEPGTEVLLSFSLSGSRGWFARPGSVVHWIGRPDDNGSWASGDVLVVTEERLGELGMTPRLGCGSDSLEPTTERSFHQAPSVPSESFGLGGTCGLKECPIAVETDYQLFQVFNDLGAMTAYMATLFTAISDRYEEQIGTVLTFPYLQFYTDSNDPWSTPDSGGSTGNMLDEFRAAWLGNIPAGATLAHFVSGAGLGGGIAYLDVLCAPDFAFGVSANIGGDVSFPIQQQSGNWDFMVIAHELGHNFAAPHTHDFNPPIDDCANGACITNGTIMSYCHLCDGGTANITTFFHPQNVALMTSAAQSCLPDFGGSINGEELFVVSDSAPTTVTANVGGTPVGNVLLFYRYDGGAFQTINMTPVAGSLYTADLPAAPCGGTAEYYFSYQDLDCGVVTDPETAPSAVYTPFIGELTTAFLDNFESDNGWTAVNLGATSGDWQRGVPVDDGGWAYDPDSDFDGSGSAFLTQNENGNTDVDDGAVELTSPMLDMSGGSIGLRYAYYLRLTDSDGTDALVVEMNTNAGVGAWTEVARHDTNGGLSWREHWISPLDLAGLGVVPSATTQVRFTANDGDAQSIVEAGVDAFEVVSIDCGVPCGTAVNYCIALPNATGGASTISVSGSTSVSANDLVLSAGPLPADMNGLFVYSPDQDNVLLGNGVLCVGNSTLGFVLRLPPENSGPGGVMTHALDNTSPPDPGGLITPGSTWYFQCWHRDPDPPAFFNFSDGMQITFCP